MSWASCSRLWHRTKNCQGSHGGNSRGWVVGREIGGDSVRAGGHWETEMELGKGRSKE